MPPNILNNKILDSFLISLYVLVDRRDERMRALLSGGVTERKKSEIVSA
jgi:hypothetical protein